MFKVKGETTVRWTAIVTEESGELNAEDATAKACEEAEDAIAGAETFATLGVTLELVHHHTAANSVERSDPAAEREGSGEDRFNLAGDGRPDHGTARTALGRTLRTEPKLREGPAGDGAQPGEPPKEDE